MLIRFALTIISSEAGREKLTQSWNISNSILPWEFYLELSEVQRPFGLELDQTSVAHYHFSVGHLCLHSFMYKEAQDAFNLALQIEPTFIEAHVGKVFR